MVVTSPRAQRRRLPGIIASDPSDEFQRRAVAAMRESQGRELLHPVGVRTLTASATMIDTDDLALCNATSGNLTYTLLTAKLSAGRPITVKKTDSSVNVVTIDPEGSETLDGKTSVSLLQQNAVRTYKSDGSNWQLVSALGNASEL